jgi:hypothetical protein
MKKNSLDQSGSIAETQEALLRDRSRRKATNQKTA